MSFCPTNTITSDAAMNAVFPPANTTKKSVFPTTGLSRDSNDRLTNAALQTIYEALISQKRLVSGTEFKIKLEEIRAKQNQQTKAKGRDEVQKILEDLPTSELTTMNDLKEEFCWYYARYKYALDQLFTKLSQTSSAGTIAASDQQVINMYLQKARDFNTKLNDLIQISNFLATKRVSDASTQSAEVNALNDRISSTFDTLKQHHQMLQKENSEAELRKRMVEYTQEKNKSSTNLLQLYGVLNIVAVGLLLYIYRS
jgi:hypothetical protein